MTHLLMQNSFSVCAFPIALTLRGRNSWHAPAIDQDRGRALLLKTTFKKFHVHIISHEKCSSPDSLGGGRGAVWVYKEWQLSSHRQCHRAPQRSATNKMKLVSTDACPHFEDLDKYSTHIYVRKVGVCLFRSAQPLYVLQ